VGHGVILHGCTVGNRVLVGMGAIVLDFAEIGDDVDLGAGAVVTPRTKIPSGVLALGQPAKPVRDLRDEDRMGILAGVQIYVDKAREYRTALSEG
jgi:carbonic anhydrase/acetyltransferase-like protein (isoleucine patch superfamily)